MCMLNMLLMVLLFGLLIFIMVDTMKKNGVRFENFDPTPQVAGTTAPTVATTTVAGTTTPTVTTTTPTVTTTTTPVTTTTTPSTTVPVTTTVAPTMTVLPSTAVSPLTPSNAPTTMSTPLPIPINMTGLKDHPRIRSALAILSAGGPLSNDNLTLVNLKIQNAITAQQANLAQATRNGKAANVNAFNTVLQYLDVAKTDVGVNTAASIADAASQLNNALSTLINAKL